jgi:replicative DNA helicase
MISDQKIRIPPNSKESEMLVLGSMLNSINSLNIAADILDDSDFYYSEHKIIFKALKQNYKEDKPADVHLIAEELARQDKLNAVGGIPCLVALSQYAGLSAYIEEYIQIIRKKSILRRMIQASQIIEKKALEEPSDVDEALDEAQSIFFKISQSSSKDSALLLKDILSGVKSESKLSYMKELEDRQQKYQNKKPGDLEITGISSGYIDLDKMINGLNNSNLMILAARPAMGKTALAVNIAEYVCFNLKMPVGIFSLEMGAEQLVHRIICSQSEVISQNIINGSITGSEYQKIYETVQKLQSSVMLIDDQGGLKITDLRVRARRMKEAHGIKLLVIDYLQLLSGSGSFKGAENRQQEVSEISRMLKTLAKELDIPILCLSQLSRKVEERENKRPIMSDLRESGSLEQDADIVMFLFRSEYYDKHNYPGQAQLIISKNRHGETGTINLSFRKEITKFENYTPIEKEIQNLEEQFK